MPQAKIKMMRVLLCLAMSATALYAQKAPFDIETLLKLTRVADPQISPDGKTVAFSAVTVDLAGNKKQSHIYTVPIGGGAPHELGDPADSNDRPRWLPTTNRIGFVSTKNGATQIWTVESDGSHLTQLTALSSEASGQIFSPDGKYVVFLSDVFPACSADDDCNRKKLDDLKTAPTKARLITTLLYRHWTQWQGPRRTHLLVMSMEGGPARDLTPGDRDVPPFSLGGPEDYAISPDSRELVYTANTDEVPAISTNSDLFALPLAPLKEGELKPVRVTSNPAG